MKFDPQPPIDIYILPGGAMPKRKSEGAIGHDVCLRAIVSANEMDEHNPHLRKTLFDFRHNPDPSIADFIDKRVCSGKKRRELVYRLEPGKMVTCGIGFVTQMPFPLCYLSLCRSGMASRHHIMVANAPGTIDPDYRGEAGIILYNCGTQSFYLYRNMRIAQILYTYAIIPRHNRVRRYSDLTKTKRGADGFGSTGFMK